MAYVATFLHENLKYYDNQDTVFMQLELRIDRLSEWMNKRDDIVQRLDEAHTSTANDAQPLILTV